ncbi:DUF1842 domain-containing protein [Pseudomonas rubra]|uniref:DUF1842 domain-containing protein n=1 Tax=Pseudomonas rubra TaxID=2942627 RepID=A0ABT5PAU6_9PSED|nr:DUF1842 domain-containing protein [Pseudomonas rubra]MDD1015064.1 DUF1842 domain-containing protein [Pseudomonas rubra]MDD1038601.1 DUF1842 domain-containing protein [Pseudomonas rubra]MDD1154707.1 DUF1842 domain-containing protein [Pseudomonas rubra]
MTDSLQAPVIGLFPLSYVIGTEASGAQRLVLDLLVHPADRTLRGVAQLTQATNPPLDQHLDVWGTFSYQPLLPPSSSKILITLQGNHGGKTANSPITFYLNLAVGTDWQKGLAGYSYLNSQGQRIVVEAPAHREETRIQTFGNLDIQAPLHATTLDAVIATGDVEHLKALAAGDAGQALNTAIDSTNSASGKAGKSSRA